MKIFKWLLLLAALPLFVACFEDKTTFAEKPLSNITIEQGIDTLYNIYKFDTLVIAPIVTQENVDKPLTYTWEVNLEVYSHDEVFKYVGEELGKYNCRLIVENEDGKTFFPFLLYVNSDYEYGITVLSCDKDGNSMLSFMQESMNEGDSAKFTDYDCFAQNNEGEKFAANAVDIVQCAGRLIIACRGGGSNNDEPTIYFLNEKTMVLENMFTVPEYDDFKPTILGVPAVSPDAAVFPILCENGKVYDFSVNEGVVTKTQRHKSTYAQNCIVDICAGYYDILLFDKENNALSLIHNGYGPFYCGKEYKLQLNDSLFSTKNHFAERELITMTKIRMTPGDKALAGQQEFLIMSQLKGYDGAQIRSEVLNVFFWGYDFVKQDYLFDNKNIQVSNLSNNPIKTSTPCIANKAHGTLFFANKRSVYRWNYVTGKISDLPKLQPWFSLGSPFAEITGFEMSEDLKKTYVSYYEPLKEGLNGSVVVFDTYSGEILETYNNVCYRPVKMFYKNR